jgi:hypothetical protein
MIIIILLIFILIEVRFAHTRIEQKISPPASYVIRGICGAVLLIHQFIWGEFDLEILAALAAFAFGFYWMFFDGLLNLRRRRRWWYIGKTKKWDLIIRSHMALVVLHHFIKWSLVVGGLVYFYNPFEPIPYY